MADTVTTPAKPKRAAAAKKPAAAKPKAAAKPRAAPRTDKANRPSPPDRDGDGKSGGSLPGNQTAPAAKGTDDAALAEQQVASTGHATVILTTVDIGRKTHHPVGVNGRIRHIPLGVEVTVDAAELEALERSDVAFEVVIPAQAGEAAVDGSTAASPTETVGEPTPTEQTEEITETKLEPDEGGGEQTENTETKPEGEDGGGETAEAATGEQQEGTGAAEATS